jgi:hypothetical protein
VLGPNWWRGWRCSSRSAAPDTLLQIPANSVGTTQLRNGAVTPSKLARQLGTFGGYVRDWALVSSAGKLEASNRPARQFNVASDLHGYVVEWTGDAFPGKCVPMVTVQASSATPPPAEYAEATVATNPGPPRGPTLVVVYAFNGQGEPITAPFYVVVIC